MEEGLDIIHKNASFFIGSEQVSFRTDYAADASCDTKAAEKKLAGAAKNSFIKKCEEDAKVNTAKADCDAKAAAKNSFTKKCVSKVVIAKLFL